MSYLTHFPNPRRREVCKRCCSNIKADILNTFEVHKTEICVVFGLLSWIVINTILFAIAVKQTDTSCVSMKIWFWFGGLTFCLPTTLLIGLGVVCLWIYFGRIYRIAIDGAERELNPSVYESWAFEEFIHLDDEVIIRTL